MFLGLEIWFSSKTLVRVKVQKTGKKKRGMKERKGGRKDGRKDEKEKVAIFKLQFLLVGNYFSEAAGEQNKCVPIPIPHAALLWASFCFFWNLY